MGLIIIGIVSIIIFLVIMGVIFYVGVILPEPKNEHNVVYPPYYTERNYLWDTSGASWDRLNPTVKYNNGPSGTTWKLFNHEYTEEEKQYFDDIRDIEHHKAMNKELRRKTDAWKLL